MHLHAEVHAEHPRWGERDAWRQRGWRRCQPAQCAADWHGFGRRRLVEPVPCLAVAAGQGVVFAFRTCRLSDSSKQRARRCAVAEGLAHMGVQINIAGTENETAAELKRIRTQFVLTMACGGSARSSLGVVASNKMQK